MWIVLIIFLIIVSLIYFNRASLLAGLPHPPTVDQAGNPIYYGPAVASPYAKPLIPKYPYVK